MPRMRSSREAYERYLTSPTWKAKRLEALEAAEFRCAGCSNSDALQVHHLTYERLGFERLTDLMVLCEQCHALEHGRAMRAGMPVAGPSLADMTHEARQRDELRRLAAGEGRDIRAARWLAQKKAARAKRTTAES